MQVSIYACKCNNNLLAGKAAPWWEVSDILLGKAAHDMCQLRHAFFPCFLYELWWGQKINHRLNLAKYLPSSAANGTLKYGRTIGYLTWFISVEPTEKWVHIRGYYCTIANICHHFKERNGVNSEKHLRWKETAREETEIKKQRH